MLSFQNANFATGRTPLILVGQGDLPAAVALTHRLEETFHATGLRTTVLLPARSELRRIGDYAETHYIPLAMHGNGGALATIAAAHVAAASRNFLTLEYHFIEAKWIGEFVKREGQPSLFKDGHVVLTDAPGLGVEIYEQVCRENLATGEKLF